MDAVIEESFDLPDEGPHAAVIVEVNPAGFGKSQKPPYKMQSWLSIVFLIEDQMNDDNEPMRVPRRMTNVIRRMSVLGRLLVAAKVPVDFRAAGGSFGSVDEALVGKKLTVTIQHAPKPSGVVFADIVAFSKSKVRQTATPVADAEGL